MPAFTMTKNWDDGLALTESMLDDIKSSAETFLNTTKLDQDNIAAGGINATCLASNAVTTAKIAALNVTRAKLEAVGQDVSDSSSTFSSSATSDTNATNLDVTLTTTGRPVLILLQSDGGGTASSILASGLGAYGSLSLFRDATEIARYYVGSTPLKQALTLHHLDAPAAGTYVWRLKINCTDPDASTNAASIAITRYKLVAFEL